MTTTTASMLLSIVVMALSINGLLVSWQIRDLRKTNAKQFEINEAQLKLSKKIDDLVFAKDCK